MLNGWDVLGIAIVAVLIYMIVNQIIMGSCAKEAIRKAEKDGMTTDDLFKYIQEKVKEAVDIAIKAIEDEEQREKDKRAQRIKEKRAKKKLDTITNDNITISGYNTTISGYDMSKKSIITDHTTTRKPGRPPKNNKE